MKTIIAGSRTHTRIADVIDAIHKSGFEIAEVVSGGARGVDEIGEWLARALLGVPVRLFPADWDRNGLAAGPIRNKQMAEYGQALIAIWDGKSRGTYHMINTAKAHGLKVYVHRV